jgi:penicillin-binding protein 2
MKRNVKDSEDSLRSITRRAAIVGGLKLAFIGLLAGRMRQLQVEEADQYRLLAEENRINVRLLAPARGLLFDRNGALVADNAQNYSVTIVREDTDDVDATIAQLRSLIPLDEGQLQRALREMRRRSPFVPVTLADGLTWKEFSTVAVNAPALPGLYPEVGLLRHYPLGPDFAHTVGYVGRVTERDLAEQEDRDPLLQMPQFKIGKFGAEARLESVLRGKAGSRRIEVNALGRVMRELDREEGQRGASVQLTMDAGLQNFIQARLGEESASAVVMDVETGDLVAAVSSPSFDPNKFVDGISQTDFDVLRNNDHRPLHNKIAQGLYPPGSTFKMVTLLAALDAGLVSPNETVFCNGVLRVGGRRAHCWSRGGHGSVNLKKSLVESCDIYYYDIAMRVGIEKIAEMSKRLGLGVTHDISMTSISSGLIPTMDWKLTNRGEPWVIGDTVNASIGQGFVLTSPLQLAVMTARLATGRAVMPRMVKSIDGAEQPVEEGPPLDIDPAHLRWVREAMYDVNNGSRGTARRSRIMTEEHKWAGKTGTSQVRNITPAERARGVTSNADLPWNRRDHALYVGFAPFTAPKYAVSVVVEHGGGGSSAAAPVARDIMLQALHGGLPPLDAYPPEQRSEIEAMQSALPLRPPGAGPTGRSRA